MKTSTRNLSRRTYVRIAFAAMGAICAPKAMGQVTELNLPPLNGYQPLVMFGMTDEQWGAEPDFEGFFAQTGSTPGGNGRPSNQLPITRPPSQTQWPMFVGVIDTGAQASILSYAAANMINLGEADRLGANSLQIIGASGSEFADITDTVGLYMTHLGNGQSSSSSISGAALAPSAPLSGMWNTSVLTADQNSVLPNIIGSPVVGLYQVSIKASQPRHVTIGATTYKSPEVGFSAMNTPIDSVVYGKVALSTTNVVGGPPALFPSDFENFGNDPTQPTIWESLFAGITVTHTAGSSLQSFLFDTGAQVSVLSSDTAAAVGIYTAGEDPTPPDFYTEIVGVGGQINQVPGFYINGMSLSTTAGPINFNSVPVIVLDLPDPRNPNQTLPGIIGTNLLNSRDIIINIDTQGTGKTGLYISAPWAWKTNGNGNWSTASNWRLALPNAVDAQANFFTAITAAKIVTVDGAGFTVGTVAFDNSNRYTLAGPGTITLDTSTGNAQINIHSGSHTISAPMAFLDDTEINVPPVASVLTINGTVTASGVKIIKGGDGTVEMKNVRAAGLQIDLGKVVTLANGTATGTSKVGTLAIADGASWDLKDNDLVVTGMSYAPVEALVKSGFGDFDWAGTGITSSTAAVFAQSDGSRSLGVIDNVDWGHGNFGGLTVSGTDILVKYTWTGDANVDGLVDNDDFGQFLYGFNGGGSARWLNGDFDYSGNVDNDDFGAFLVGMGAFNASGGIQLSEDFQSQLAEFASENGLPLVLPEPAAMMLPGLAMLLARRRRAV